MVYNKKEIMDVVAMILGKEATGVYIHKDVVKRNIGYDDASLLSSVGENPFYIESIEGFEIHYGMTKLCIYPLSNKIPYVIKIPITHIYKYEENEEENYEEEDYEEEDYENEDFFINRKAIKIGSAIQDACDAERVIFEYCSSDVQDIMAENYYIDDYNDIPVYIQEKAYRSCATDFAAHGCKDGLENEIGYLMDINSDIENEDFVYNVILNYGIQRAVGIFEEVGNEIDDLHDENYGYNREGKTIIFDYAGYNRFDYYEFDVA